MPSKLTKGNNVETNYSRAGGECKRLRAEGGEVLTPCALAADFNTIRSETHITGVHPGFRVRIALREGYLP